MGFPLSQSLVLLNFHFPEFILAPSLKCYVICGKDKTRPTNLFYFIRGATITVADWPPKFLFNLEASQEFTGCNPEFAILSSFKLLHCISFSFDGDLFLSRVQYRFSTLDYRILLVQGFGNGTITMTIAGKPFGRRSVKWWFSVRYLSDARYITAKLRKRMREKRLRYLRKYYS